MNLVLKKRWLPTRRLYPSGTKLSFSFLKRRLRGQGEIEVLESADGLSAELTESFRGLGWLDCEFPVKKFV